jgi:hypothetical protein
MNWDTIIQESRADVLLAGLVDEVREYAQIYLLAKERQKGCSGMAEFVSLKEEFKDAIEKLLRYCRKKNNRLTEGEEHDTDLIASLFSNIKTI